MKPISSVINVAWLLTALCGAHGSPQSPEDATLGDAIRASIQDAIRGAVTHAKEAHMHTATSGSVASSFPSIDHDGKPKTDLLTHHSSLRGRAVKQLDQQNPWRAVKPLRIIDHALEPTAPMDNLNPGIEAQSGFLFPPGYYPRAVYYPKEDDKPNPFPQHYHPEPKGEHLNHFTCYTAPDSWMDVANRSCEYYEKALLCTRDGKPGPGWRQVWGSLDSQAVDDIGPVDACCFCGGGARVSVVGRGGPPRWDERRLIAPEDRDPDPKAYWFERDDPLPYRPEKTRRKVQAPEDAVPMPYRQVAPADKVPMKYSRYFNSQHDASLKGDPRGWSARFYKERPQLCESALPPVAASRIDRAFAFSDHRGSMSLVSTNGSQSQSPRAYNPVYPEMQRLEWPAGREPTTGLWWAKWSGTLRILDSGNYTFNLDIGFETETQLRVDGISLLTDGQCLSARTEPHCVKNGCKWSKDEGKCVAQGQVDNMTLSGVDVCPQGSYRSSPILITCDAKSGSEEITLGPAGTTTIMTIPAGVAGFQLSASTSHGPDIGLQVQDPATKTWVLNFGQGILNNQQHEGTYRGQSISFSGYTPEQAVSFAGITPSPLEVSIKNYGANPTPVRIRYLTEGLQPCPGPNAREGCSPLNVAEANQMISEWDQLIKTRYQDCSQAWAGVTDDYPSGEITWNQWASVWNKAWSQETPSNSNPSDAAHSAAWQKTFAVADTNNNGYISQDEFETICQAGAPAPAPPMVPHQNPGQKDLAKPQSCVRARIRDRSQWPANAFAGTGYSDSSLLNSWSESSGPCTQVANGVMVKSFNGKGPPSWFYPTGTYDCVRWQMNVVAPGTSLVQASHAADRELQQTQAVHSSESMPVKNSMMLSSGGHCVEAMIMVTQGAESVALKYSGPDTGNVEVVIPGLLVHCDPVIQACSEPTKDECKKYKKPCAMSSNSWQR